MKRYHTYFVSWIVPNKTPMHIGNLTFSTYSTGVQLVKDSINAVQTEVDPTAVVLNIVELD